MTNVRRETGRQQAWPSKHSPIADYYAIYEARPDRPVNEHPDFGNVFDGAH